MKTPAFLLSIALAAFTWAACQTSPTPPPSGKLNVLATHSIVGDWVQAVGGDTINLRVLVPAGSDAHTFAPTAVEAAALTHATLVFETGLGFETWLGKMYAATEATAPRITVTEGLTPLMLAGTPDPHIWHDVAHAMHAVEAIREALTHADPAHAEVYQTNAEAYRAQLQALDKWIIEQVDSVPPAQRKLVTTHDTLGYFAARYGFEIVGTVLPTTTEGAAPSAQALAALVEVIKATGVKAVFAENVSSNAMLNQIAAEANVQVVATLYTDALGPLGSDGDTYLTMMRFNVTTLVNALK